MSEGEMEEFRRQWAKPGAVLWAKPNEALAPEANKVLREMVSTWTDPDEPSEAMLVLIDCMRPSAQEIIQALDRKGYEIRRKSP